VGEELSSGLMGCPMSALRKPLRAETLLLTVVSWMPSISFELLLLLPPRGTKPEWEWRELRGESETWWLTILGLNYISNSYQGAEGREIFEDECRIPQRCWK
jgi:hypothetical protein